MQKVIIVVLGADGAYTPLIQSIRDTWGPLPPYKVIYCYGWGVGRPAVPAGTAVLSGDVITCGSPEGVENIYRKTLITFQYLLQHEEFDYVFRCCAGSYINKESMSRFLEDKPRSRFYCGIKGSYQGVDFASGSGYFLSKDLVQLAADHANQEWPLSDIDDVSLGRFMCQNNVPIFPGARRLDFDPPVDLNIWVSEHYHYHFRNNVSLMHEMHARAVKYGRS